MTRRVICDPRPRFIVRDPRGVDPECGHCSSAQQAYEDLALALMLRRERWASAALDSDEMLARYERLQSRLARWLAWTDEREHGAME